MNNHKKIRAINRLDRDTSGIVLFAKNEYIQERMIKGTKMEKEYIAFIAGVLKNKVGTINLPIKRKNGSIMEREVSEEGQTAITHYEVLKEVNLKNHTMTFSNKKEQSLISIVKLQLETGRTHQIRVHMAYCGTPILGDTLYGKVTSLISRQALHAFYLKLKHPITEKWLDIIAPIPDDMKQIIKKNLS